MTHVGLTRRTRPNRIPRPLLIPAVLGASLLLLPLLALVIRTPWAHLGTELRSAAAVQALWLSLWTATCATAISVIVGVPLAWFLARREFAGRRLLRALVILPLVLPPVVGGVALLLAFGRNGVIGNWLYGWFGLSLPFTPAAVILAQTFVAMPFLIVTVEGALRGSNGDLEAAAETLGAQPWHVFRRVSLPLIAPSLAAGAVLCWARALGEFGATITFAGSFPGRTQTMPIAVYYALENDPAAAIALSLVLLVVSLAVLIGLRDRWFAVGSGPQDRGVRP